MDFSMKHTRTFGRIVLTLVLCLSVLTGIFAVPASADGFGGTYSGAWCTVRYGEKDEDRQFLDIVVDVDKLSLSAVNKESIKDVYEHVLNGVLEMFLYRLEQMKPDAGGTMEERLKYLIDQVLELKSFNDVNVDVLLPLLVERGYFTLDQLEAMDWDDVFARIKSEVETRNAQKIAQLNTAIADLEAYLDANPSDTDAARQLADLEAQRDAYQDELTNGLANCKARVLAKIARMRTETAPTPVQTVTDLLSSLRGIKVDGQDILADSKLISANLHYIYERFLDFSDYANRADADMKEVFDVTVISDYGTVTFDLTLAFAGNCDPIRTVFKVLSQVLSIERVAEGDFRVAITLNDTNCARVLKVLNYEALTDSLRLKIFTALSANADGLEALISDLTFDELIEVCENIDFTKFADDSLISRILELSGKTNEEVVANLKKYEGIFDKAASLAARVLGRLPESLRAKTLFDLYKGNGAFHYATAAALTPARVESALARISPKAAAVIASTLDFTSKRVSMDLKINCSQINSVIYKIGDTEIRRGFLPAGADVTFFANCYTYGGETVSGWYRLVGSEYVLCDVMPDADVVLYGKTERTLTVTPDTPLVHTFTYDGNAYIIRVVHTYSGDAAKTVFTYRWYKNGVLFTGETSDTLALIDVSDSGKYFCEVTATETPDDGVPLVSTVRTAEAHVTIEPVIVNHDAFVWDGADGFDFDGNDHSVSLQIPAALQAYFDRGDLAFAYTGELTGNAAQTYHAAATLQIASGKEANFTLTGGADFALDWEIRRSWDRIDLTEAAWRGADFVYDGNYKSVTFVVQGTDLVVRYIGERRAVYAGTYHVSAYLDGFDATTQKLYVNGVEHENKWDLEWTIDRRAVSAADFTWLVEGGVYYDGTRKTVRLAPSVSLQSMMELGDFTVSYSGETSAVRPGNFHADATIRFSDAAKNSFAVSGAGEDGALHLPYDWSVRKAQIVVNGATWDYTAPFAYAGTEYGVSFRIPGSSLAIAYAGTCTATNAGVYTAQAMIDGLDAELYEIIADGEMHDNLWTLDWKIAPQVIDVSDLVWNGGKTLIYNGTELVYAIDPADMPANVIAVAYSANKQTNAGDYSASVTLRAANTNYVLFDGTDEKSEVTLTKTFSVAKAVVDLSAISFADGVFTYDKTAHNLAITGTLPDFVEVTYTESATDAGSYTVTATFTVKEGADNYEAIAPMHAVMVIRPAMVDLSGITLNDAKVKYDGEEHSLSISGTLPQFVNVAYNISAVRAIGEYRVIATFSLTDHNYVLPYQSKTATLTISGSEQSVGKDAQTPDVKVVAEGDVVYVLVAEDVTSGYIKTDISSLFRGYVVSAHEIYYVDASGAKKQVEGNFTVRLLIPEGVRNKNIKVLHITDETTEEIAATRDGDYMVFETTHFSVYALAVAGSPSVIIPLPLIIGVGAGVLALAILIIVLVAVKKKKRAGRRDFIYKYLY